eukprot:g18098.t1
MSYIAGMYDNYTPYDMPFVSPRETQAGGDQLPAPQAVQKFRVSMLRSAYELERTWNRGEIRHAENIITEVLNLGSEALSTTQKIAEKASASPVLRSPTYSPGFYSTLSPNLDNTPLCNRIMERYRPGSPYDKKCTDLKLSFKDKDPNKGYLRKPKASMRSVDLSRGYAHSPRAPKKRCNRPTPNRSSSAPGSTHEDSPVATTKPEAADDRRQQKMYGIALDPPPPLADRIVYEVERLYVPKRSEEGERLIFDVRDATPPLPPPHKTRVDNGTNVYAFGVCGPANILRLQHNVSASLFRPVYDETSHQIRLRLYLDSEAKTPQSRVLRQGSYCFDGRTHLPYTMQYEVCQLTGRVFQVHKIALLHRVMVREEPEAQLLMKITTPTSLIICDPAIERLGHYRLKRRLQKRMLEIRCPGGSVFRSAGVDLKLPRWSQLPEVIFAKIVEFLPAKVQFSTYHHLPERLPLNEERARRTHAAHLQRSAGVCCYVPGIGATAADYATSSAPSVPEWDFNEEQMDLFSQLFSLFDLQLLLCRFDAAFTKPGSPACEAFKAIPLLQQVARNYPRQRQNEQSPALRCMGPAVDLSKTPRQLLSAYVRKSPGLECTPPTTGSGQKKQAATYGADDYSFGQTQAPTCFGILPPRGKNLWNNIGIPKCRFHKCACWWAREYCFAAGSYQWQQQLQYQSSSSSFLPEHATAPPEESPCLGDLFRLFLANEAYMGEELRGRRTKEQEQKTDVTVNLYGIWGSAVEEGDFLATSVSTAQLAA